MPKKWIVSIVSGIVCAASLAAAHEGVRNPAVKARMDAMSEIAKNTKVLGSMAKGERAFDQQTAIAAARAIASGARETPALFRVEEDDPVSEAKPAIWQNFAQFEAKSLAMEKAAQDAAESIRAPEDLPVALAAIGASCKSCHESYRE